MNLNNRTNGSRDTETAAETNIDSCSLLRNAIVNMDRDTKKTITSQQSDISSFDNYIEKKK